MEIVVQKFGGTSVATEQEREYAIKKVKEVYDKGDLPVVVVSAMGQKGSPYATDTLLSLTKKEISSSRDRDLLLSCGEIISSVIFSQELRDQGYPSQALSGPQAGIKTDDEFGNARIEAVKSSSLNSLLEESVIPVVAGFQGATSEGDITTLGRGGSDTTAVALGVFLDVNRVEIYTDVDSLMTADPRLVSEAKPIHEINFTELFNLAQEGAKIIHPRAVQIAMENHVPLYITCAKGSARGTKVSWRTEEDSPTWDQGRVISGLAHMDDIAQLVIKPSEGELTMDLHCEIFSALARENVSVDLINVLTSGVYLTVSDEKIEDAEEALKDLPVETENIKNCSKISLVGNGMRGVSGVMERIFETLRNEDVPVLQTADSNTTVSCLIPKDKKKAALNGLHKTFSL